MAIQVPSGKNTQLLGDLLQDTLIGIIIGWGGFNALIPNVLSAVGEVNQLGSFHSLRIFSLVYFGFFGLLFWVYWCFRGSRLYYRKVFNDELLTSFPRSLIHIVSIVGVLVIPSLYFNNPFFHLKQEPYQILPILWIFTCIGVFSLCYKLKGVSRTIGEVQLARYLKVNLLVGLLLFLFGVAGVLFAKPWIIYSEDLQGALAVCFLALTSISIVIFRILCWKADHEDIEKSIAHLCYCFSLVAFIIFTIPTLSFDEDLYDLLYFASSLMLVIATINLRIWKRQRITRRIFTKHIVIVLILNGGLWSVGKYFNLPLLKTLNYEYFENRVASASLLPDDEIYPILIKDDSITTDVFALADSLITTSSKCDSKMKRVTGPDSLFVEDVKYKNFQLGFRNAYKLKKDSTFSFRYCLHKDSKSKCLEVGTITLSLGRILRDHNIRKVFYKNYSSFVEDVYIDSVLDDRLIKPQEPHWVRRAVKKKIPNIESLSGFYHSLYNYIDESFIKNRLTPSLDAVGTFNLTLFAHPIDYYTQRFNHHREKNKLYGKVKRIKEEQHFVNNFEFNDPKAKERLERFLKTDSSRRRNEIGRLLTQTEEFDYFKRDTSYFIQSISRWQELSRRAYAKQYKSAQIVFSTYLKDSQRVGLFILIAYLSVIVSLYGVFLADKKELIELKLLDSSNRVFFISIFVLLILIIQISRLIKPENINPEKPYWMMDLANWYTPAKSEFSEETEKKPEGEDSSNLIQAIKDLQKELSRTGLNIEETIKGNK